MSLASLRAALRQRILLRCDQARAQHRYQWAVAEEQVVGP
jgi:hypothetical protein